MDKQTWLAQQERVRELAQQHGLPESTFLRAQVESLLVAIDVTNTEDMRVLDAGELAWLREELAFVDWCINQELERRAGIGNKNSASIKGAQQ